MKIIALVTDTLQVSPDDWEPVTRSLECSDKTTVLDLKEWLTGLFDEKYTEEIIKTVRFTTTG